MILRGLLARWRALHLDYQRITGAVGWLLLFGVTAKVAVAGKDVAIAWRFGRGAEVDAYNLAFTLSTWLPLTLFSVMTVVLVPALVRLREKPTILRQRFLAELNGAGIAMGLILMILVWFAAPFLIRWFAGDLPQMTQDMASNTLRSFAPLPLLALLVAVNSTRLQAANDHRYVLAEGLAPLVLLLSVILWEGASITPIIFGTLLGAGLQLLWLTTLSHSNQRGTLSMAWPRLLSGEWSNLWRSGLVMGAGSFALSLSMPLDQYFAATLGPGAIATYGYANRVIAIGMTLSATVVSRATLVVFSEGIAQGDGERVRRHAFKWVAFMFMVGGLGGALIALLAPWIVALLFQRGAFTEVDTEAVANAMRWGLCQLPFFLGGLVLVSLLASQSRYLTLCIIGVIAILAKLAGNLAMTNSMGLSGILLSSALMYAVSLAACMLLTRKLNSEYAWNK